MDFRYKEQNFSIKRYPTTDNKSLKAWSAADEHVLKTIAENKINSTKPIVYNDRFGFLSTVLSDQNPTAVIDFKSQTKAIEINLKANQINPSKVSTVTSLDSLDNSYDLAILKIPKSLDLFRLQLVQLHKALNKDGQVVCSFMTKYFSRQILSIAKEYFELCEQSKAWKKSRVLVLKQKKEVEVRELIHSIPYSKTKNFKQHYGVFSAKNIDYASQFFIENMEVTASDNKILDLASGNGVLAYATLQKNPSAEVHLMDDSFLAVESSKMNLDGENIHFHYNNSLSDFEDNTFDLIISNPPFHFEYETNIEVAIELFKEVRRCLKKGGSFQMVTSHHLNSKTHLQKLFHRVNIIAEDKKFVVYNCI